MYLNDEYLIFREFVLFMAMKDEHVFQKIGLLAIYVIKDNGLPLLARYYDGTESTDKDDILVSSFLGAISLFAQSMLISYVSDIGIYKKRLFFKYQAGLIYIVAFKESILTELTLQDMRGLIEESIWEFVSFFYEFYNNALLIYKDYELMSRIEEEGETIDKLIEKGCLSWQESNEHQIRREPQDEDKNEATNDLSAIIKLLGINSIYVIDKDNKLVFNRDYQLDNILAADSTIMTAFLNAIQTFAKKLLTAELSDVGMFNQRIFLRKAESLTYVIVVDDLLYLTHSKNEEKIILNTIFRNIIFEFKRFLANPLLESEAIIAEDFRPTIDQIICETFKEYYI